MDISFTPSPDVVVLLNALLDKYEKRAKPMPDRELRAIKASLAELELPTYFSQVDPSPRLTANEQLQQLEQAGVLRLSWLPGETGHLLQSAVLQTEHAPRLFAILQRAPVSDQRTSLETLLLADCFRFSAGDWRTRAIRIILDRLRAGKSASPFSLIDPGLNLDLLTVLSALSSVQGETPCRVFSVQTFNNSKRFDDLKPALLRLARLANPEWKLLPADDLLRELNLVANPGYIHLSGNWELTGADGQIISLAAFAPSVGFPASQAVSIQSVAIYAPFVLCIENLTSFHEFIRANLARPAQPALLCLMGNPSPAIRRLLYLISEAVPIHVWADMDYGGFNILSQLRRQIGPRVKPWLMDAVTFDLYASHSRPLKGADARNIKCLALRPELDDVRPAMEHIFKRGLKLEQEAIHLS